MVNGKIFRIFPLLIFVVLSFNGFGCGANQSGSSSSDWGWQTYSGLGEGRVPFTVLPLDEGYFDEINPMGHMQLPQHPIPTAAGGFVYTAAGYDKPLRAPADGVITEIRYTHVYSVDGSISYPDYSVRIYHTNTFQTWFDHLSAIDDSVLASTGALTEGTNTVYVSVTAGQTIAKTAASGQVEGLGVYVYDKDLKLDFVNPDRRGPFTANTMFFVDNFTDPLKTLLYTYVKRTAEPRGGKVDFDKSGKLVGNWIIEGADVQSSSSSWNYFLAFVYDMWTPTDKRISIGVQLSSLVGIGTGLMTCPVSGPDYEAVDVASGEVVYKLATATEGGGSPTGPVEYTMLVKLESADKIKVELFNGDVATPAFSSSALYYTR